MVSEDTVREQLKNVIDPELGVNIVDLGLIYEIETDDGIDILMTLTTPGCPLHGVFGELVTKELTKLDAIDESDVDIELTFEPPWDEDKMSDEARAKLGFI